MATRWASRSLYRSHCGFTSPFGQAYHLGVMVRPRGTTKPQNRLPWSVQSKNNLYRACFCCEVKACLPISLYFHIVIMWCTVFLWLLQNHHKLGGLRQQKLIFYYNSEGQKSKVNYTELKSGVDRSMLSGGSRGETISCHCQLQLAASCLWLWLHRSSLPPPPHRSPICVSQTASLMKIHVTAFRTDCPG